MTVYVDDYRGLPVDGCVKIPMSHLTADSVAELHDFAASIGLKRSWFQPSPPASVPHYDVSDSKRNLAIAKGAIAETWKEGARRRLQQKKGKHA